jgi:hypothetical protein
MFRKAAIAVSILLLAFTTACGSGKSATDTAAGGNAAATASAGACPAHNTKAFAKTRFVADAGLAAGAFKRYIYTPYQDGKFRKGTHGRVAAIAKAVAAGAFVLNRLSAARQLAHANPTLCKFTIAPLGKFTAAVQGIVTKGKSGNIDASDVTSTSGVLGMLRSAATSAGAGFKDQNATVG